VAPALEHPEAGRVLDEGAQLLGPAREDLLDPSLADDGAAEAQLGEELDDVRASHGRAVHEVLPFAAAVQAPSDRQLREVEAAHAVGVLEDELDLAERGRRPLTCAREEDVVGLLGAELRRAEAPRGPDDRVGDVGLPRAVRADEDGHAGLEPELDGIGKALEAAQADACEVHGRSLPVGPDAAAGVEERS